jgi:hypothetical protein
MEQNGRRSAYADKLRDPRWQRRRLEIMQRDYWRCTKCRDKESTLHVHHRYYLRGTEPWEYPPDAFMTLCERCHTLETQTRGEAERQLLLALCKAGVLAKDVHQIAEAFDRIPAMPPRNRLLADMTVEVVAQVLSNPVRYWMIHVRD